MAEPSKGFNLGLEQTSLKEDRTSLRVSLDIQ
jgi:hypothetical protein